MHAKKIYRGFIEKIECIPEIVENTKTFIAEDIAIYRKRNIYNKIIWTDEQQKQFDLFWTESYGRKISNKWHRLYQASSGVFSVDYIPEKLYTTRIEPILNDRKYARVLEDKYMAEILSVGCDCQVPETLICCSGGQYYDGLRNPISLSEAISRLRNSSYLIKPTIGSSSGKGLLFVDKNTYRNDIDINQVLNKMGDDFIVQDIIVPHPAYAALNPSSINTIRITTFIANNEIHHVPLVMRIGRKNARVDNIHAGGLAIGVTDEGELLQYAYELGYGDKFIKYSVHPESQIVFKNYKIPNINGIINAAYQIHGRLPHTGIVSWDFTVGTNGKPILIEANIMGQGIWLAQMIYGRGPFGEYTEAILRSIK